MSAPSRLPLTIRPAAPTTSRKLPCQRPQGPFRTDLPAAFGGGSCAVVGSSDLLRLSPRGAEIDSHSFVWRLNNAPTAGWEAAVGRRTSLRVINHVPIEKWLLLASNRSALAATRDGDEYQRLLCAPGAVEHGCVVSLQSAGRAFATKLEMYRELYPSHHLSLMSDAMQRFGTRCNSELHGSAPSGGLLTVLLALAVCDSVSLFGFWPFCCRAHRGWPRMHYKYSQGNRTSWVCCSRGREKMELEFGLYETFARKRLLNLIVGEPPPSQLEFDASAGAARTAPRLRLGGLHISRASRDS